jgi:ankyrin repeat protein
MQRVGSRVQVMHGNAKQTGGGLKKKDLKYNKNGKVVSKKMSVAATKKFRLQSGGASRSSRSSRSNRVRGVLKKIGSHISRRSTNPRYKTLPSGNMGSNALQGNIGNKAQLRRACIKGQIDVVEDILKTITSKTEIDNVDSDGDTALILASFHGHTEIAQALLAAGADKDVKNNDGITALICACIMGYADTVQALLAAGADKEAKDKYSFTALISASMNGHIDIVHALLAAGADMEAKDRDGNTALICASVNGHTETAQALVTAGADKEAKDTTGGRTALEWASARGHTDIVNLLE